MSEADPLIGAKIDRYQVERQIGSGGMGRVYRARQPEIGARVAIKVVNAFDPADGEEWTRRLFAEARAVNLISHENIVNVLDMVRLADGRPALVMEYLNGVSLDRLIHESGAPLPLGIVGDVGVDVLSAIGAAHRAGILHRDLKPANVFVTPEGRAKVLDFGIAKSMDGVGLQNSLQTQAGVVLGTAVYMAPEQARGEEIDERADLFAVGLILYEAVTRRRAIRGPSLGEVLEQHDQPIPAASEYRAEVTGELDAVIDRALHPRPADRYASAAEMADALRAACESLVRTGQGELTAALQSTGRIELGSLREQLADPEAVRTAVESARRSSQVETRPQAARPPARRSRWPVLAVPLAVAAAVATALLLWRSGDKTALGLEAPALAPPIDAGSAAADAAVEAIVEPYERGGERAAAVRAARRLLPDAEIAGVRISGGFTKGGFRLDRTTFALYSPARADAGRRPCAVIAEAADRSVAAELDPRRDCAGDAPLPPPRCSIRDIMARSWLRARSARGSDIALELAGDHWELSIDGQPQSAITDSCGESTTRPQPRPEPRGRLGGGDVLNPFN